jgi:pimeloyl-ACP methyl ester carboxylesterase
MHVAPMRTAPSTTGVGATRGLSRDDFLYPGAMPHRTGRLALDRVHTMYWEECGNPRGFPALFLHGGPGGGIAPDHRRYFDPAFYRIVLYDQRGAGQSTPLGELADNTTAHLVGDLERLRAHLGIDRWLVFGGSWGSTLGLAYAEAHPERVAAIVLRGIFLAREWEIRWFMHEMGKVFPEAWNAFASFLPEAERGDLLGSYYRRLTSRDPSLHMPAAHAWSRYERCFRIRISSRTSTRTRSRWRSRGSKRTTSCTAFSWAAMRSSTPSIACGAFLPASSRGATISSAPSAARTIWRAPGRRRNTSSCPMRATRRASRASPASWSPRPIACVRA